MGRARTVTGQVTQYETPNWAPLARVMDEELMGWFMWMFEVTMEDGTRLHAYKHQMTRRYIHLTTKGGAFVFCGEDSYRRLPLVDALELALQGWEILHACPESVTAAWDAIKRARRSSRTRRSGRERPSGAREARD